MFMSFDPVYWMFIGPAILFAMWAQFKVKSSYSKWSKIQISSLLTGYQAAYEMLKSEGLENTVKIVQTSGFLSDHYDPREKVLRLSADVYSGNSVSSVGIACHEAGHALQHAKQYQPLVLRNMIVPVASIGSWIAWPMIFLGMIFRFYDLAILGVIAFSLLVIFQLINLPVEFNASNRAKEYLRNSGILNGIKENGGVSAVLNAAAMTYVAATAQAILQLLYFALRLGLLGGSDDW